MTIYVLPHWEKPIGQVFDVTSRSKSVLSPFTLGPVELFSGETSVNMENAWQYSKVYAEHDNLVGPTNDWWRWARDGWRSKWANRYPMGRGRKPEYAWNGRRLDYIDARWELYIPMYQNAVLANPAACFELDTLSEAARRVDITIVDFDAYNHHVRGMTLTDVFNNPRQKAGHGFVVASMIEMRNSRR